MIRHFFLIFFVIFFVGLRGSETHPVNINFISDKEFFSISAQTSGVESNSVFVSLSPIFYDCFSVSFSNQFSSYKSPPYSLRSLGHRLQIGIFDHELTHGVEIGASRGYTWGRDLLLGDGIRAEYFSAKSNLDSLFFSLHHHFPATRTLCSFSIFLDAFLRGDKKNEKTKDIGFSCSLRQPFSFFALEKTLCIRQLEQYLRTSLTVRNVHNHKFTLAFQTGYNNFIPENAMKIQNKLLVSLTLPLFPPKGPTKHHSSYFMHFDDLDRFPSNQEKILTMS